MAKGEVYRFIGTDGRSFEVTMTDDTSKGIVTKVITHGRAIGEVSDGWTMFSSPRYWTKVSSSIPMDDIYKL